MSEDYLKASLHRRVAALRDDPETPLFFGRLDLTGLAVVHERPLPGELSREAA